MFCTECGKRIPDDSIFCPECGYRLEGASAEPAADEQFGEAASVEPAAGEANVADALVATPPDETSLAESATDAQPDEASVSTSSADAEQPAIEETTVLPAADADETGAVPAEEPERACPVCGTPVPADSAFCFECGHDMRTPEPEPAPAQAPTEFRCPYCHQVHGMDTGFCTETGKPVSEAQKQAGAAELAGGSADSMDATAVSAVADANDSGTADGARSEHPAEKPAPSKKKGGKTAFIATAVVVVLALVGVGGFFAYRTFFAPQDELDAAEVEKKDDGSVSIDEKTFPDAAMRAYVEDEIDADGDGSLSQEECDDVTAIDLEGVSTVDNLALFPNLETLSVDSASQVEEPIDFSGNAKLSSLSLPESAVTSGLEATQVREDWMTLDCELVGKDAIHVTRDESGRIASSEHDGIQRGSDVLIASTYTYDEGGNIVRRVSTSGGVSTTYDYSYDADDNVISADWNGNHNSYSYDGNGNLTSVIQHVDGGTYTATFEYDSEGRCTRKVYDDGTAETWQYDSGGRCTRYEYPLDDAMNVMKVSYGEDEIVGSVNGESATYTLGDDGRIESATSDSASAAFSYDAHGNLTEVVVSYDTGRESIYTATYARRFVPKDAPPSVSMAAIEPSYDGDIVGIGYESFPYIDINGQPYTFVRNHTYSAIL